MFVRHGILTFANAFKPEKDIHEPTVLLEQNASHQVRNHGLIMSEQKTSLGQKCRHYQSETQVIMHAVRDSQLPCAFFDGRSAGVQVLSEVQLLSERNKSLGNK